MSITSDYARVTKIRPCPICGKPDWCLIRRDGSRAICARTESSRPYGEAGWLHTIGDAHAEPMTIAPAKQIVGIDIAGIARRFEDGLEMDLLLRLAERLGVEPVSLDRLRMGWSKGDESFSFPMRDPGGTIVGVRLRSFSGEKWSVRGSKPGLFYDPFTVRGDMLFVVEGPTDTATILDLGESVIGRPSCTGGVEYLLRMIKADQHIVIVADHDEPKERKDGTVWFPGMFGANRLAEQCHGLCRSVRIIEPLKGKDIREWKRLGLTRDGLRRVVQNSPTWSPTTPGSSSTPRPTQRTSTADTRQSSPSQSVPA